jgi:hypothetical protein
MAEDSKSTIGGAEPRKGTPGPHLSDLTPAQGNDAKLAKEVELAGRATHAISAAGCSRARRRRGYRNMRGSRTAWLRSMKFDPVGKVAELDRPTGYCKLHAAGQDALGAEHTIQTEVRNALALGEAVERPRAGRFPPIGTGLEDPRPK